MADKMNSCRFLITGGLGFIGLHTVEHLLKLGHSVRILDSNLADNPLPEYCIINSQQTQLNIKITGDINKSVELIFAS